MSRNWAIAVGINHYDNLRDLKSQPTFGALMRFLRVRFDQMLDFLILSGIG